MNLIAHLSAVGCAVRRTARWLFAAAVGVVAALSVPLVAASTPFAAHASLLVASQPDAAIALADGDVRTIGVAPASQPVASQPTVTEGAIDADGERLLAGADRYATSVLLASVPLDAGDAATRDVLVVSGESLVDAVSAVSVAASRDAAIVLTATDQVPEVVRDFVARRGFDTVTVGGGTAAVSAATADALAELTSGDAADVASGAPGVERIAGATRFETAVAAARAAGRPGDWCDTAYRGAMVVSGESLVDGVIAAPVAYAWRLPLLFTEPDALPEVVAEFLKSVANVRHVTVVGAPADIKPSVVDELTRSNDIEVLRIDAATPAERSVELAEAVAHCRTQPVAPGQYALLDANQPVDGVAAAAALANGLGAHGTSETLIPVLAVNQNSLPQPVADYLTKVGRRHDTITLYPLGGVARLTPSLVSSAVVAAEGNPLVGVPPDERWPVGSEARANYVAQAGAWVAPPGAITVVDPRFTTYGTPRAGVPTSRRFPQGAPVAPDSLNRQDYTFEERQAARRAYWEDLPETYSEVFIHWKYADDDPERLDQDRAEFVKYGVSEHPRVSYDELWAEFEWVWSGYRRAAHSVEGSLDELDAEWWIDWYFWACRTTEPILATATSAEELYTRQRHALLDQLDAALPGLSGNPSRSNPILGSGNGDELFSIRHAVSLTDGRREFQTCLDTLALQDLDWLRLLQSPPRRWEDDTRNAATQSWRAMRHPN